MTPLPGRGVATLTVAKRALIARSVAHVTNGGVLRWAKSCDNYCRVGSESYRCDSHRGRLLAVISPSETQKSVLTGPAFVVLRFESRDWRSFV